MKHVQIKYPVDFVSVLLVRACKQIHDSLLTHNDFSPLTYSTHFYIFRHSQPHRLHPGTFSSFLTTHLADEPEFQFVNTKRR